MDQTTYDKGMQMRREVLGDAFVAQAEASADAFFRPFLDFVTEYAWGAVWGREALPKKTRSLVNLALLTALNRPQELQVHVKAALRNGVTPEEIREVLWHAAIYAGVPAAMDSFRVAREVLKDGGR